MRVPLRESEEIALVCNEIAEKDLNCKKENIKDILSIQSDIAFLNTQQIQIIDFVSKHYISPIHHALALYFPRNLQEKIIKNTVEKIKIREYTYSKNIDISLTEKQEKIYNEIYKTSLNPPITGEIKSKNKFLIYGVTGSGKTQIYMKIIEENLKK